MDIVASSVREVFLGAYSTRPVVPYISYDGSPHFRFGMRSVCVRYAFGMRSGCLSSFLPPCMRVGRTVLHYM